MGATKTATATASATKTTSTTKWTMDTSHSEICFSIRQLMVGNVTGSFKECNASIYAISEDFVSAEIHFWLNPASIDTGDEKRDEHLKSAEFFDVENHKQISFTGNTFEKLGADGKYELYGDLTMKGISKQIKLDVTFGGIMYDPRGNEKAGFFITGKINRKDWGLNWNNALDAGGVLVGEEVKIICELELEKQV